MKKSSKEKIKGVAQMGVTLGHIGAMLLSPKGVKDKYDITDSYQKAKEFFNNSNKHPYLFPFNIQFFFF